MSDTEDLTQCRETNKRLNRRLQTAEAALCEWREVAAMAAEQRTGRFSPALMAWALTQAKREIGILLEALEYIAHFDEAGLTGAATLHWDMNGKAKEALKTACDLYPGFHGDVSEYVSVGRALSAGAAPHQTREET